MVSTDTPTPDFAFPDLTELRVLCVDDFRDAAASMAGVLELLEADVRTFNDALSALAAADDFLPHAAILDIHMPGVDGCELARRLRSRMAGRPLLLIAMTGVSDAAARRRTTEAGFDLHLTKGSKSDELFRELGAWAARVRTADWPER